MIIDHITLPEEIERRFIEKAADRPSFKEQIGGLKGYYSLFVRNKSIASDDPHITYDIVVHPFGSARDPDSKEMRYSISVSGRHIAGREHQYHRIADQKLQNMGFILTTEPLTSDAVKSEVQARLKKLVDGKQEFKNGPGRYRGTFTTNLVHDTSNGRKPYYKLRIFLQPPIGKKDVPQEYMKALAMNISLRTEDKLQAEALLQNADEYLTKKGFTYGRKISRINTERPLPPEAARPEAMRIAKPEWSSHYFMFFGGTTQLSLGIREEDRANACLDEVIRHVLPAQNGAPLTVEAIRQHLQNKNLIPRQNSRKRG